MNTAWLTVSIPVCLKGVGGGWGQGSLRASHVLPHQTVNSVLYCDGLFIFGLYCTWNVQWSSVIEGDISYKVRMYQNWWQKPDWDIFNTYISCSLIICMIVVELINATHVFHRNPFTWSCPECVPDALLFPSCRFKTVHCLLYPDTNWCPKLQHHHINWKHLCFHPAEHVSHCLMPCLDLATFNWKNMSSRMMSLGGCLYHLMLHECTVLLAVILHPSEVELLERQHLYNSLS